MTQPPAGEEWRVLGVRSIYESKWIKLNLAEVELPSGQRFEHHSVTMPAAAMAVVISDDGKCVLLSWRHRFVPNLWNYELPGGLIDEGEAADVAVAREILEETGYQPREIRHLTTFEPMIGMVTSPHHVFLATGAEYVQKPTELDEGQYEWVAVQEIPALIAAGKVQNSGTLVGLLHYLALGAGQDAE